MTPRTVYYDSRNHRVELGDLLASGTGGEGKVFKVVGQPSSVAKIYHDTSIAAGREKKLEKMLTLPRPDPRTVAWPTATLHQTQGGRLVGFLMPFLPGEEVHEVYSYKGRTKHFPDADWAFLIQTATNCAVAFDAVHRMGPGIAMGDVNERNVKVTPEALVRLLDCDSFHITAGGELFPCGVGVDTYTPPELQGQSLRTVVRTHNHDRFGLAVLIFQLLFVGRHPFCGRPLNGRDLSFVEAVKEFRFAYSRVAAQPQIAPPPYAPLLDIVPADVGRLFERAFSTHSAQPGARPPAQEWATALGALQKQLKTCARVPGHTYSEHLSQCCWCDLMQAEAPNYFLSVSVRRQGSAAPSLNFVLGPVWSEIDRVRRPNAVYQRPAGPSSRRLAPTALPAHVPSRVPAQVEISRQALHKIVMGMAIGAACILPLAGLVAAAAALGSRSSAVQCGPCGFFVFTLVVAIGLGVWGGALEWTHQAALRSANAEREAILAARRQERDRRRQAFRDALRELEGAENEWRQTAEWYQQSFDGLKRSLESLKTDYLRLKPQYEQEYRELERNKEAAQRDQFLQTLFIRDFDIPGIGPTREAVLRSYGIETAYDIEQWHILQIGGFGPVLTGNLLAWKRDAASRFHFNAGKAVSSSEVAALEGKYRQSKQGIEAKLRTGLGELRGCSEKADRHLPQLYARIPGLVAHAVQAKVDLQVLSKAGP